LGVAEQKKELPIHPGKKAVVKTDTTTTTGLRLEHYEKNYRLCGGAGKWAGKGLLGKKCPKCVF